MLVYCRSKDLKTGKDKTKQPNFSTKIKRKGQVKIK